jgi:hypothetical protein
MPYMNLKKVLSIGKIRISKDADTGKLYIKIGKGRTRRLWR